MFSYQVPTRLSFHLAVFRPASAGESVDACCILLNLLMDIFRHLIEVLSHWESDASKKLL